MRIAVYAPRASYLGPGYSGDLVFVRSLLRGLEERGHELEVVSRLDVRDPMRGRARAARLLVEAASIRRLAKRFDPDAWLVYGATAKHPDLYGWWQRPRRYVLLAAGLGRAERVPSPWRHLFRFAHRRSLARADRIVAYRPKSREDLRAAGVPEERLGVLPLAIEPWDDVPAQDDARRALGLPLAAPTILSVSRLTAPKEDGRPWKTEMVLEVVNALADLPDDVLLVVVGDGPGRERVETRAAELGIESRVRLVGEVPNPELPSYYAACDLFALPDLRDFPWLSVLEAQSCGRPVVTSDTRAARLTVDAGRTGLLAKDSKEFRSHLHELTADRDRCRRLGEAGPGYVARHHSLDVRLDQIEELLAPSDGREDRRRMRIAFYSPRSTHLEHALAHGGDPIFLEALFGALRKRGHEVRVVSRLNVRDLWRGRIPARRFLREALKVRRETKRFQPDGWLVYNPSPTYPDLFGWWLRPRRYVLFAAHSWQSRKLPSRWRRPLAFAFRRSLRRADEIVAVRPVTAKRLRAAGAPAAKLRVLPPGVQVETRVPSREEARRRLGLPDGASVVLVVSRFTDEAESKEKKTETVLALLEVFRTLSSDAVLAIVGDGPGRPRIERAIRELGLEGRIKLLGAVDHDDLKWCFAACDVYAYPDLLDRPRLSVLEAQACGRPVVAMRTGSAELTVDEGRTGLLGDDLEEFGGQLGALTEDPARRKRMGRAAREYVVAEHSIDVRARQLEEWLRT